MEELMQLIKESWHEGKYNRMPTGQNWITIEPFNDGNTDCLNVVVAKEIDATGYPLNPISFITLLYEADVVIDKALKEICKFIYEEALKM